MVHRVLGRLGVHASKVWECAARSVADGAVVLDDDWFLWPVAGVRVEGVRPSAEVLLGGAFRSIDPPRDPGFPGRGYSDITL